MATYQRHGNRVEGQCSGLSHQNGWPGNCTRAAVEEGMCRPHLTGKKRRDERQREQQAAWAVQRKQRERERAQATFAATWRAEHPDQSWGNHWQCPICSKILQASEIDPAHQEFLTAMVEKHQRYHGQDWAAYEALAAGADRATGEVTS